MYKILPETVYTPEATILYDTKTITVPRCKHCQTQHKNWFSFSKDILREDKKVRYPEVENLERDGWMHGRHPNDLNRRITWKSFFLG